MKIETKYNIGDKVWRISHKMDGTYYILDKKHPKQITEIVAEFCRKLEWVRYYFYNIYGHWETHELFATKSLAQAACRKRNKENQT